MAKPLFYVKLFRAIPVVIPDTSSHPFLELADKCNNPPWHSVAGEYLSEKGAVDRVVCLLKIDQALIPGLNFRFCVVIGKLKISRYLVGWERETTGISTYAHYLVGWEWYNYFLSVTIWVGVGQHDLAGNDLDDDGNVDLSQKHPKSQLPWFYRGTFTAVKIPR